MKIRYEITDFLTIAYVYVISLPPSAHARGVGVAVRARMCVRKAPHYSYNIQNYCNRGHFTIQTTNSFVICIRWWQSDIRNKPQLAIRVVSCFHERVWLLIFGNNSAEWRRPSILCGDILLVQSIWTVEWPQIVNVLECVPRRTCVICSLPSTMRLCFV